jgi:thiol-disulfide isomerase/thioredoxin
MMTAARFRRLLLCALALASTGAWASFDIKPWPAAKRPPPLTLADLDGRVWNDGTLRGRVVVLNFWATWCEPCRAEMPALAALAQRHSPDTLIVLAANYQESEPKIRRYLETIRIGFPVLLDRDGAAAKAWTSRIFPTTIVIGADGRPRHIVTGEYDWNGEAAAQLLAPLLRRASK